MRTLTPEWALTVLWFIAGVGATGAFWYFLSQRDGHATLWTAFGTSVIVLLAITLNVRNDLIRKKAPTVSAIDPANSSERRPHVFFKHSAFVGPLGGSDNMQVDLLLSNSGNIEAKGAFENISFRFEPAPYAKELRYFEDGAKGSFTLAPAQETSIRLGSKLPLTAEMIAALTGVESKARLYIFARGWYSDLDGSRKYDLSFCRIYHPSMPGNLIYCSDDIELVGP